MPAHNGPGHRKPCCQAIRNGIHKLKFFGFEFPRFESGGPVKEFLSHEIITEFCFFYLSPFISHLLAHPEVLGLLERIIPQGACPSISMFGQGQVFFRVFFPLEILFTSSDQDQAHLYFFFETGYVFNIAPLLYEDC